MALRLTPKTLPPEPSHAPAAGEHNLAAELSGRATAALLAGEVGQYLELFALAAEHPHPSRRYQAQKVLLERGFALTAEAPPSRAPQLFGAIARAAVAVLESQPREPVLLNYAGVAFYELWALDAARALFEAAQRLDPEVPHLRRNLRECKRRRRAGGQRRPLQPELPELAHRAKRVAAHARPATELRLSLCMIVRDEEEMLPRCLAAIAPAVDEIIVVDTGSVDDTIEIAKSFGARVIEHPWTGSFADARNVSFDAATGDWILYLDADEVLVSDDLDRLRALTGRTWREAFYLVETNFTGEYGDGTGLTHNALRVFRNRDEYRFDGRLHEQIAQQLPAYLPERLEQTSIRVEHYGYLGAVRSAKEKSRRNIDLLLAQQAESPPTPFLHFNLGSEYAAAGDAQAALVEFERAWSLMAQEDAGVRHEFKPSLVVRLVKALRFCGRGEDAIARAQEGLTEFPGFTDLVFEQATASLVLGRRDDAVAYYERCIAMGDASSRYAATVGCGTYLPRLALAELYLSRGELEPARELLDWCLERHPGFFGTVLPYASALLRSGMDPDAVVSELEQRVAHTTPTVRFMLGTALYECGASVPAEAQFRLVLESQPHGAQPRVALAEALLSQRRYLEAAAEAVQLPEDDPLATVACRSELFGRIAGGDRPGVPAALERARRAGLPDPELELFAGWAQIAAGGEAPVGLPLVAVPLLGVILEALLRVQDFTTFEALVGFLRASQLPPREQRELLAGLYLQRGFLQSAAIEWMAVCDESPDARALAGLAKVALLHGLPEDARTFAAEALNLDAGNAEAKAVLSRVDPGVVGSRP
jgi:glycosyltransferase involved in cell wall biosynthesis